MRWLGAAVAAAAILAALVSGGGAAAQPGAEPRAEVPPPVLPPGWVELLPLARAARAAAAAAAPRLAIEVGAWGDPSAGCFAVVARAKVRGAAAALHRGVAGALVLRGAHIADFTLEEGGDATVSRATFAVEGSRPLRGALITVSAPADKGLLDTVAAACFYDSREPEQSEERCVRFISQFEP